MARSSVPSLDLVPFIYLPSVDIAQAQALLGVSSGISSILENRDKNNVFQDALIASVLHQGVKTSKLVKQELKDKLEIIANTLWAESNAFNSQLTERSRTNKQIGLLTDLFNKSRVIITDNITDMMNELNSLPTSAERDNLLDRLTAIRNKILESVEPVEETRQAFDDASSIKRDVITLIVKERNSTAPKPPSPVPAPKIPPPQIPPPASEPDALKPKPRATTPRPASPPPPTKTSNPPTKISLISDEETLKKLKESDDNTADELEKVVNEIPTKPSTAITDITPVGERTYTFKDYAEGSSDYAIGSPGAKVKADAIYINILDTLYKVSIFESFTPVASSLQQQLRPMGFKSAGVDTFLINKKMKDVVNALNPTEKLAPLDTKCGEKLKIVIEILNNVLSYADGKQQISKGARGIALSQVPKYLITKNNEMSKSIDKWIKNVNEEKYKISEEMLYYHVFWIQTVARSIHFQLMEIFAFFNLKFKTTRASRVFASFYLNEANTRSDLFFISGYCGLIMKLSQESKEFLSNINTESLYDPSEFDPTSGKSSKSISALMRKTKNPADLDKTEIIELIQMDGSGKNSLYKADRESIKFKLDTDDKANISKGNDKIIFWNITNFSDSPKIATSLYQFFSGMVDAKKDFNKQVPDAINESLNFDTFDRLVASDEEL